MSEITFSVNGTAKPEVKPARIDKKNTSKTNKIDKKVAALEVYKEVVMCLNSQVGAAIAVFAVYTTAVLFSRSVSMAITLVAAVLSGYLAVQTRKKKLYLEEEYNLKL